MAALPCPVFIPVVIDEEVYCSQCGLTFDYHQAHQGVSILPNVNIIQQHHHQPQLQQQHHHHHHPQQQLSAGGYGVIPHNWHDIPMAHLLDHLPADPNHVHAEGSNHNPNPNPQHNNNPNNNNNNPEPEEETPEIRSWAFNENQIRRMLAMARKLQWSLRGRSRDAELHQFCAEINVNWSQFVNWVHRNRDRFANQG